MSATCEKVEWQRKCCMCETVVETFMAPRPKLVECDTPITSTYCNACVRLAAEKMKLDCNKLQAKR